MTPKARAAAALALVVAACTGNDTVPPLGDETVTFAPPAATSTEAPAATMAPSATTVTSPPPATTLSVTTTVAPRPPATATGRLVVLDEGGNVTTVDPDGEDRLVITDAATEGAAYFQPLWAPGSAHIAWGEASPAGFGLAVTPADGTDRTLVPMPAPPFYLYWAPDGEHVAALHNGTNGVDLEIVTLGGGEAVYAGTGVPFYISWNPDSADLAAHIGTDRLARIDVVGTTSELGPTAAVYQAPQWVPGGIIHVAGDEVRILDESGRDRVLATVTGVVAFVADRAGARLAVSTFAEDAPALTVRLQAAPVVPANVVMVVDLTSGVTDVAHPDRALAFFWSPDGEKLLILGDGELPGEVEIHVWTDGETRFLGTFAPPRSFVRDVLPFFQQYAQSYQPWSPDSSAIAFAGDVDGEEGVWVQDAAGGPPRLVSDGTWVSWSVG